MENQTLFQKLLEKIRLDSIRGKSTIKKCVIGLLLTSSLLLSSCDNVPEIPDIDFSQTENGDNLINEEKFEGHSEMLYESIFGEYYKDLTAQAKTRPEILETANFNPHPFAFLEDEGYVIYDIKKGNLACYTTSYILDEEPNNLYMATYVETKGTTPYYTEYLLKYELTDQEVEDYKLLHSKSIVQAVYLNDIISDMKEVEIISKTRCTVEAHNNLDESLSKLNSSKKLLKDNLVNEILLKGYDVDAGTFEVYLISGWGENSLSSNKTVAIIPLRQGSEFVDTNADNAFCEPSYYPNFKIGNDIDYDSGKTATIFHSQNVNLSKTKWYTNGVI